MALKNDIIQESLKVLSLNGFLNTGVNDILLAAHTSKGGFYNHFSSKEDLFHHVLAEAQRIWRNKVLAGLDDLDSPLAKVKKILVGRCSDIRGVESRREHRHGNGNTLRRHVGRLGRLWGG